MEKVLNKASVTPANKRPWVGNYFNVPEPEFKD